MDAYFEIEPLKVMLSSRCTDSVRFEGKAQPMGVLRSAIKAELEGMALAGEAVFRVWIHEDEAIASGSRKSWDKCMAQSRRADLFLMLYNGTYPWHPSLGKLNAHT